MITVITKDRDTYKFTGEAAIDTGQPDFVIIIEGTKRVHIPKVDVALIVSTLEVPERVD